MTIDGQQVTSRDQTAHLGVTMIPQGSGLAAVLTAFENCLLPLLELGVPAPAARLQTNAALNSVGLADSGNHLIEELSGGQQQRVAVARALATHPRLLIADEPTSELDHTNREKILDLISALARHGCAVVMATHDPGAADRAGHEIHLDEGRVTNRR